MPLILISYFLTCAFKALSIASGFPVVARRLPKPNAMAGVRVDWLTDTNLLRWIMTSDWLLCEKGIHNGSCFAMNSAKSNPFWQMIRRENYYLCGSFSHSSLKLHFFCSLFFHFLQLDIHIACRLTSLTPPPPLSPPPAHAFTHMSGIESDIFQQALLPISHC